MLRTALLASSLGADPRPADALRVADALPADVLPVADALPAGALRVAGVLRVGGGVLAVRMVCPTCGAEYDAGAMYCGKDGSQLRPMENPEVRVCEKCGRRYEEPFDYCPEDGGRLIGARAQASHDDPAGSTPWTSDPGSAAPPPQEALASATRWRRPDVGIAQLLSRTWELFKADFLKYLGVSLLITIPSLIGALQPFWELFLVFVPLPEGLLITFALQRARGIEPQFDDVDRVVSVLGSLVLANVVGILLMAIGFLLLIIPGIYLGTAFILATPLVIDRGLRFSDALETSRKVVTERWFAVFVVLIVVGLVAAVMDFLVIGWLIALPLYCCAVVAVYEAAFGIAGGAGRRRVA